jgi:hypothetical protein
MYFQTRVWTFYMGIKLISLPIYELVSKFHFCIRNYIHVPGYENLYLGGKLSTRVWKFVPGYETRYLGMKLCTWLWNFVPGYETFYLGMKLCTWVWNSIPGHETLYLGMKLCTWVWNFVPGNETMYSGVKLCTGVWNFVVGYETYNPRANRSLPTNVYGRNRPEKLPIYLLCQILYFKWCYMSCN